MPTRFARFALILSSLAAVACGTTREAQYDADKPAAQGEAVTADAGGADQLVAEGDAAWAERLDKEKLMVALQKWEEAAKTAPSAELYVKLSRGHYFLADGFYDVEGDEAKRDEHYTTGLGYAEKAIGMAAPAYVEAIKGGSAHVDVVGSIPDEAIPAFYWQATNLGKWAASKGFATRLKYKDDIKATMDRVMSGAPDYFYAAPFRYFGAFEAATSGLAGGSLEKSNEFFAQSVEKAPNYLGTKVLWASYYCTKKGDRELFEKLLNEVLAADANVDPDIMPENTREQAKAKKLLANADDEF